MSESTQQAFGLSSFLSTTDAIGLIVALLLLGMSVASWAVMLSKTLRVLAVRRGVRTLVDGFWAAPNLARAADAMRADESHPFAALALTGVQAAAHHQRHQAGRLGDALTLSEFVTRALRQGINAAQARLETGLSLLASVGSTAPFVGLFGTVWGIYHALISIAATGQATIDKVAGPVGEALIMTALGLAVAIPAVLGYNALTRLNRVLLSDLDAFAHDLHAYLATGAKLDGSIEPVAAAAPVGTLTPKAV
ncbi:MAG: MotA/TolQ/ExbB proton channel family protein [Burkholderiales bacterium]|jgi:biopolymer transport protein ExbB|nr:MotA/TolQ/ExbB proton channel family protein [Burkholderiales bacterium]